MPWIDFSHLRQLLAQSRRSGDSVLGNRIGPADCPLPETAPAFRGRRGVAGHFVAGPSYCVRPITGWSRHKEPSMRPLPIGVEVPRPRYDSGGNAGIGLTPRRGLRMSARRNTVFQMDRGHSTLIDQPAASSGSNTSVRACRRLMEGGARTGVLFALRRPIRERDAVPRSCLASCLTNSG